MRHGAADGAVPTGAAEPSAATWAPDGGPPTPGRRRAGPGSAEEREAERGLRGLVGAGASQVGISAALRARDAARPTEEDLADAERRVVVVRRRWVPRDEAPRAGR